MLFESLNADPVVAEIHEVRRRLLEASGGDVVEFRRRLRERENLHEGGQAYAVEFVDGSGHTVALITVDADDVRPIVAGELLHARRTA